MGFWGDFDPVLIQFVTILFLLMLGLVYYLTYLRNIRKEEEEEKAIYVSGKTVLVEPEEKRIPVIVPPQLKEERKPEISELLDVLLEQEVTEHKLRLLERQLSEIISDEIVVRTELVLLLEIVRFRIRPQYPALEFFKPKKQLTTVHKAKIAAARRGKKKSEEEKAKIASSMKGRKMSDEHKAKIAAAKKGKKKKSEKEE